MAENNIDIYGQFDGLDRAAETLVDVRRSASSYLGSSTLREHLVMRGFNLLIHHYPRALTRTDFDKIAALIEERSPDIRVDVLGTNRPHPLVSLRAALRPTVSIELNRAKFFRCLRGKTFRQWVRGDKSLQYGLLESAGIPVPRWTSVTPETRLDPSEWGEYVVEKPDRGKRGAYVRTRRTGRVRYRPPEELAEDNPGRDGGMLVQKLVFTGYRPVSHRVLTLFGTPLLAFSHWGGRGDAFVDKPNGKRRPIGPHVTATGIGCLITLLDEEDVIDLACRTHRVFPEVPILGIDIVRDADDGSLWVLEVNPNGGTWTLGSSRYGRNIIASSGLDFYGQFDALNRAADKLVEVCRDAAV